VIASRTGTRTGGLEIGVGLVTSEYAVTHPQSHNFPEPDLNEAARAADASREAYGAMVACRLR
jgi:hypothetical protein